VRVRSRDQEAPCSPAEPAAPYFTDDTGNVQRSKQNQQATTSWVAPTQVRQRCQQPVDEDQLPRPRQLAAADAQPVGPDVARVTTGRYPRRLQRSHR
jgi:hypothetical protein